MSTDTKELNYSPGLELKYTPGPTVVVQKEIIFLKK